MSSGLKTRCGIGYFQAAVDAKAITKLPLPRNDAVRDHPSDSAVIGTRAAPAPSELQQPRRALPTAPRAEIALGRRDRFQRRRASCDIASWRVTMYRNRPTGGSEQPGVLVASAVQFVIGPAIAKHGEHRLPPACRPGSSTWPPRGGRGSPRRKSAPTRGASVRRGASAPCSRSWSCARWSCAVVAARANACDMLALVARHRGAGRQEPDRVGAEAFKAGAFQYHAGIVGLSIAVAIKLVLTCKGAAMEFLHQSRSSCGSLDCSTLTAGVPAISVTRFEFDAAGHAAGPQRWERERQKVVQDVPFGFAIRMARREGPKRLRRAQYEASMSRSHDIPVLCQGRTAFAVRDGSAGRLPRPIRLAARNPVDALAATIDHCVRLILAAILSGPRFVGTRRCDRVAVAVIGIAPRIWLPGAVVLQGMVGLEVLLVHGTADRSADHRT
ncbi:MAG: hypothetical protein MZV70_29635 [Desulfobacterales bacterium]|nr:hypothetical protein [Desulfobacterales bacterium]